jgi:hypothetical protein
VHQAARNVQPTAMPRTQKSTPAEDDVLKQTDAMGKIRQ